MLEKEQANPFNNFKTIEIHLGEPEEMEHVTNESIARQDKADALKQGFTGVVYKILGGYVSQNQQ